MFDNLINAVTGTDSTPVVKSLSALNDVISQLGTVADTMQSRLAPISRQALPMPPQDPNSVPVPLPDCPLTGNLDGLTARLTAVLNQLSATTDRLCL